MLKSIVDLSLEYRGKKAKIQVSVPSEKKNFQSIVKNLFQLRFHILNTKITKKHLDFKYTENNGKENIDLYDIRFFDKDGLFITGSCVFLDDIFQYVQGITVIETKEMTEEEEERFFAIYC